ncbi:MAG: hypothetical protein JW726_09985, partial [Anaerolineales bacterium]|nr:hypothetical protein [Anaerolineales bacterium]
MTHLGRKLSSLFFPLFLLVSLLAASGCGLVQEYFPLPTAWEFPTLTPRPTLTGTPELTSTATSTLTPTEVTPAQAGTGLSAPWIGIEPENVSQIDLIVEAGRGMPQQMTFAPDDSLLAVATTNGVYLHDPSTLANTLSIRTNRVQHCLALSASRIASGDEHGVVKTWDRAGELQMELNAATQPVLALAFSPDG